MTRRIWILARKELKSFFDSSTAYVLLTVWAAVTAFFFFRAAYLIGEVSIRPLFELLPWLLLFFVPAVTMRSLAGEKQEGTLEMLLSHPISEAEVVAGKLVANVLFMLTAMLLTLTMPLGLSLGGSLDIGMVVGQYAGALFLIVGLGSVGLFASATSRSQTTAFIVALALCFTLVVTGLDFVLMAVPSALTDTVRQLSALTHFESMTRGVIALSDVAYFMALATVFMTLSYFLVRRDRESINTGRYQTLRLGTALISVVSILAALIATSIGGRLDLTADRVYSLSSTSIKMVRKLPEPVTITLYASRGLPPEAEVAYRDVRDKIVDYQAVSRGRVKSVVRRTGSDAKEAQRIAEAGIQEVQFNVLRQDEYQVKKGHLGLTVEYKDQRETIPFVNQTADLEYQLTSLIRKVSAEKRLKVGFILGDKAGGSIDPMNMGASQGSGYVGWQEQLREQYDVEEIVTTDEKKVPDDVDVVVLAGFSGDVETDTIPAVSKFLDKGGSVLALVDAVNVDESSLQVTPVDNDLTRFVAEQGLEVEGKLVFDMQSNQPVALGDQQNQYLLPYPFWMKVGPASDNPAVRDIGAVTIPWGQPVKVKKGTKNVEPLLRTTQFAGVQEKNFDIAPRPDMSVDPNDLKTQVVAAAREVDGGGRLVVVGNSVFLTDKFLSGGGSENGIFGLNVVDWLAQDLSLSGIRSKAVENRLLVFSSDGLRDFVRYFNLIGVPVLIALLGLGRMAGRRRLTGKEYRA